MSKFRAGDTVVFRHNALSIMEEFKERYVGSVFLSSPRRRDFIINYMGRPLSVYGVEKTRTRKRRTDPPIYHDLIRVICGVDDLVFSWPTCMFRSLEEYKTKGRVKVMTI